MGNKDEKNKCKLISMFSLNVFYFVVELIVGVYGGSTALIADSFHMLSDVAALTIAFIAVMLSPKRSPKNTFGWVRAEILGALINTVFLLALCFTIVVNCVEKFIEPRVIKEPLLVLIVGSIGLIINIIGLIIFMDNEHSHYCHMDSRQEKQFSLTSSNRLTRMVSKLDDETVETVPITLSSTPSEIKKTKAAEQLNIRGVNHHVLADALGSVVVVISALVAYYYEGWEGNNYIDPIMSLCMVSLILWSSTPLLKESSMILLQSVPDHINLNNLEQDLLKKVDGILEVHELHVWQLTGDRIIATAHIKCRSLQEYFEIAEKVKAFFHNEGIHSTTIQPEFLEQCPVIPEKSGESVCYLSCVALQTTVDCSESTCCPPAATTSTASSIDKIKTK